jgi:hypothetical protein
MWNSPNAKKRQSCEYKSHYFSKLFLFTNPSSKKKNSERLVPDHPAGVATSNDSRGVQTACEWLSGSCFCDNVGENVLSQVRTSVLGIVCEL